MISIASARASTPCPGVSRRPPIAPIASQKAPAPIPSSIRPPLRMSRLATDRATTAGCRSGRLSTLGASFTRPVAAARNEISVQVSRNRGW